MTSTEEIQKGCSFGKELPGVGVAAPRENAADMKTIGWEITLSYNDSFNLAGKPLNISTRFLLADTRSWITKFDNPTNLLTQYYVGQEFGEIWGLQSDGLLPRKMKLRILINLKLSHGVRWISCRGGRNIKT